MAQDSKDGSPMKGGRSGRKFKAKSTRTDSWINPAVESQFLSRSREDPQTERLIARLDCFMQDGDAAVLAEWIKEQSWSQISKCLILQSIREGPSMMSALHGMALFLKVMKGAPQVSVNFVVESYVKAGCDINEICNELMPRRRSRHGFTPLLLAIERQNSAVAKALINAGADVNKCDTAGYSPLHWAAIMSLDVGAIAELVRAGADMTKSIDKQVPPILHVAVDEGRVEMVSFLLESGVDVNTESTYSVLSEEAWARLSSRYDCGDMRENRIQKRISAVGRAVRMRKHAVLEVLLRHPKSKLSLDELHFCILEGDSRTANIILEHMDKTFLAEDKIDGKWSLLCLGDTAFQAKYEDDPLLHTMSLIQTFVKYGWDVNLASEFAKDEDFRSTLLMRAVMYQDNELVRFLIGVGAQCTIVNHTSEAFRSALHCAINNYNLEALKIFAEAGMDFTIYFCNSPAYVTEIINNVLDFTVFDAVLTIKIQTNSTKFHSSDYYQHQEALILSTVKGILEHTDIAVDELHVLSAMTSLNATVVLEVLTHLPEEVSLQGCTLTEEKIPALQWFFGQFHCCLPRLSSLDKETLVKIARSFLARGYNVNEYKPHVKWMSLSTMAIHWIFFGEDTNIVVLNFLMETPEFNWNQKDRNNETPTAVALRLCLMAEGGINDRMYNIVLRLLGKGVTVDGLGPIVDLMREKPAYFKMVGLIKSLWWAGADFNGFESFLMEKASSVDLKEGDKDAIKVMDDWWLRIGSIPHLTRLAAITVRRSLKYHDLESLPVAKCLKEWIREIPRNLYA